MMQSNLELYKNHRILYSSISRGLSPLIELDNFLTRYIQSRENLELYDKVIGKAAAILIHRMNIKVIRCHTISLPAKVFLEEQGLSVTFKKQVNMLNDKIDIEIHEIHDPEEAYRYLVGRRII